MLLKLNWAIRARPNAYAVTARGVCWNTSSAPTIVNSKTVNGSGSSTFTSSITGLTPGTVYFVRSYATNSVGTSYGNEVTFITQSGVIGLATTATTAIMAYTASSGGTITSDGGAAVTARGVCWSNSLAPTVENFKTVNGSGSGIFTSSITGLTPSTTYYVRSYATNNVGTSYGNEVTFTTKNGVINLATTATSAIVAYTATSGGTISSDGGATVTARGVCWNKSSAPTIANSKTANGSGIGSYTSLLTGLTPVTTYFVRSYATNSFGTVYGNEVSFTTLTSTGTVTDIENNIYNYITIGTQTWMVGNLKTTKYKDGTSIPYVTDASTWITLTTPGYSFYNNDVSKKSTYGALYNWYTVNSGKLAPNGWHVPTDGEWITLQNYLIDNGFNYDGTTTGNKIAKSLAAKSGWSVSTTTGAIGNDLTKNNTSGFTGLPGGYRGYNGTFENFGTHGIWWSSTEYDTQSAWVRDLYYDGSIVSSFGDSKHYGFYVRCVRDY